jgi:hypothetical protein
MPGERTPGPETKLTCYRPLYILNRSLDVFIFTLNTMREAIRGRCGTWCELGRGGKTVLVLTTQKFIDRKSFN